jgi:hypothetical protein
MEKYSISSQTVWRYKNMSEENANKMIAEGKKKEALERSEANKIA